MFKNSVNAFLFVLRFAISSFDSHPWPIEPTSLPLISHFESLKLLLSRLLFSSSMLLRHSSLWAGLACGVYWYISTSDFILFIMVFSIMKNILITWCWVIVRTWCSTRCYESYNRTIFCSKRAFRIDSSIVFRTSFQPLDGCTHNIL